MFFRNNERAKSGIVFSLAIVANIVYQLVFSIVLRLAKVEDLMSNFPLFIVAQFLLPLVTVGAVYLYFTNTKNYVQKSVYSLRKPSLWGILLGIGAGITICYGFGFLNGLVSELLLKMGVGGSGLVPETTEWYQVGLYFVVLCLLPSFSEEFIFRGAMLSFLGSAKTLTVCLVSGAFFSLMHMNLYQMVNAFLAGSFLALLVVRTGSIWPAIIAHFVNNTVTILQGAIGSGLPKLFLGFSILDVILAAVSLALMGLLVWFWRKGENKARAEYRPGIHPLQGGTGIDTLKCAIPGILVAIVMLVANSIAL